MTDSKKSICLLPKTLGIGGGASFQVCFSEMLRKRGYEVHNNPLSPSCGVILVNGGTRHLDVLWRAKRRGLRIVQRLDGFNWIHRKRSTGVRHFIRSELNNRLLQMIRRYLSDAIIYQSGFVQKRWDSVFGSVKSGWQIIYNGVDLTVFSRLQEEERSQDHLRLLVVEGRLRGGHELGLENAIRLAEALQVHNRQQVELVVAADVDHNLIKRWTNQVNFHLSWLGFVPRDNIPELDRSAHLLFSAEVNPPCPNSVIEALACGLPVISFATGSLPELVTADSGRLVPYGENYPCLGVPDVAALAEAAGELITNQEHFRQAARERAEDAFDINHMVDRYLEVLFP